MSRKISKIVKASGAICQAFKLTLLNKYVTNKHLKNLAGPIGIQKGLGRSSLF
jgi:hypothetical protein